MLKNQDIKELHVYEEEYRPRQTCKSKNWNTPVTPRGKYLRDGKTLANPVSQSRETETNKGSTK